MRTIQFELSDAMATEVDNSPYAVVDLLVTNLQFVTGYLANL